MGSDSIAQNPKLTCLIGEVDISPDNPRPLGGLNPFNNYFDIIGSQFKQLLIDHVGLQANYKILDVGCGTGRLAKQLIDFVNDGEYYGFDINTRFIDYCRSNYRKPNFHFDCFDLEHSEFNHTGKLDPNRFIFPYDDRYFDLVIAIAIFNHFTINWITHYIQQIARVLKVKKNFFGTFLLLNKQSIDYINTRLKQPYCFPYRTVNNWYDFESRPLFNVAHPEVAIRRIFIRNRLMIREPINCGEWCGSKIAITGPDVIIAQKR